MRILPLILVLGGSAGTGFVKDVETLGNEAWDVYQEIENRLFEESQVMNRIIVTAERNKNARDNESQRRYGELIEESRKIQSRNQPFYNAGFSLKLTQAVESSDSAKLETLLAELQGWKNSIFPKM